MYPPSSLRIFRFSVDQVTVGVGTPLARHLMVILVLVSAVTLLPTPRVMGFLSRASMVCGFAGTSTFGLERPKY